MKTKNPARSRSQARRFRAPAWAAALLLICGTMAYPAWRWISDSLLNPGQAHTFLQDLPGVERPAVLGADQVKLPDSAYVIGVSAAGQYRAYLLAALNPVDGHVVNDLLGGVPVSVTYCDRNNCVQVFSDPLRGRPLDIRLGGWTGHYDDGSLLLLVDSKRYRQDSGQPLTGGEPFPYTRLDFVRTTWKKWREAHPRTDVYVGTAG